MAATTEPKPAPAGSLASLLDIELNAPRNQARPGALPLGELKLAPEVFQHRREASIPVAAYDHVAALARSLKVMKEPLAKVLVVAVGNDFYVVDGHHRVAAYELAQWKAAIPVECFNGGVLDARDAALTENIKGKLPMTLSDKQEAAWGYTVEGRHSKQRVHELTTVSDGTLATMRRVFKDHPKYRELTWAQAKRDAKPTPEEADAEDWREAAAVKLVQQLLKNTGGKFMKYPDVLAMALEMINPELPRALVSEWPEQAEEVTKERKALDI